MDHLENRTYNEAERNLLTTLVFARAVIFKVTGKENEIGANFIESQSVNFIYDAIKNLPEYKYQQACKEINYEVHRSLQLSEVQEILSGKYDGVTSIFFRSKNPNPSEWLAKQEEFKNVVMDLVSNLPEGKYPNTVDQLDEAIKYIYTKSRGKIDIYDSKYSSTTLPASKKEMLNKIAGHSLDAGVQINPVAGEKVSIQSISIKLQDKLYALTSRAKNLINKTSVNSQQL